MGIAVLCVRVGSRGKCGSPVSDVSSLDLYSIYSVNSDPVITITNLSWSWPRWRAREVRCRVKRSDNSVIYYDL